MSQPSLLDTTIANRYRVVSTLGEGAMGCVYLANDLQLHREVALKVLRQQWVRQPEIRQRLENECLIMARLGPHQHIVTLFDRLEYEGDIVLVMEFVPGETLSNVLQRLATLNAEGEAARKTTPVLAGLSLIALQPSDAIRITLQCLDALEFAHSRGILHRDIKPSNIMLVRDHNGSLVAKVMDFGIGKALSAETENKEIANLTLAGMPGPGTPAYMAPEQIDPQRFGAIGPHTDLYALGATLYEMLTMRTPFQGTYTELLHAHTNLQPPDPVALNGNISADLKQVVLKALAKQIADRYPAAPSFRADLAAVGATGGTVLFHPAAPPVREQPQRNQGKKYAFGLLGAGLVLVLGSASWFFVTHHPVNTSDPVEQPEALELTVQPTTDESPPERVTELIVDDSAVLTIVSDTGAAGDGKAEPNHTEAETSASVVDMPQGTETSTDAEQARHELMLFTQKNSAMTEKQQILDRHSGNTKQLASDANWTAGEQALERADTAMESGDYAVAARQYEVAAGFFHTVNSVNPVLDEPGPVKPVPPPVGDREVRAAASKAESARDAARRKFDGGFSDPDRNEGFKKAVGLLNSAIREQSPEKAIALYKQAEAAFKKVEPGGFIVLDDSSQKLPN